MKLVTKFAMGFGLLNVLVFFVLFNFGTQTIFAIRPDESATHLLFVWFFVFGLESLVVLFSAWKLENKKAMSGFELFIVGICVCSLTYFCLTNFFFVFARNAMAGHVSLFGLMTALVSIAAFFLFVPFYQKRQKRLEHGY